MSNIWQNTLKRVDEYRWEIPVEYKTGMRVPGRIYATEEMLDKIWEDNAFEQVANVAFLPGVVGYSLAMPDIHWGYGFAIGGVAATDVRDGVVSPGGVGFDINCGVRILRTNLTANEIRPKINQIVEGLYQGIPSGVGSKGTIKISGKELRDIMLRGSKWAIDNGFGEDRDISVTEESGCINGADPDKVSRKARERGIPQLGTLGSGNHFLEVGSVREIYDKQIASVMGIHEKDQVTVMIHTGSRGFGHQICTDHLALMGNAVKKYEIKLPDRQLACAPVASSEGRDYLAAMAAAANYAWTNRQCITHRTREILAKVLNKSQREIGLEQIYDVAHNIAKIEEHTVDGKKQSLCVHRKGATRAFPPNHPELPDIYKNIGQPVLIPGDMGRYSYVAIGTDTAMNETFASTCHGAGRMKSRSAAKKSLKGVNIVELMANKGIAVRAGSMASLAEEASEAYKDVAEVVDVTDKAGISKKVLKLKPMGVIKG
ncbi:MAG: RtcB family protein [Dehalococcoidales bacterium]|nr:MAG: RtcB family protein [Dehalococcoidales bacterium]